MPKEFDSNTEKLLGIHLGDVTDDRGGLVDLRNEGAFQARGYVDEQGEPTELGEEYLTLRDAGIFDQHGKLTQKGEAFAMDRQTALAPANLDAYIVRQQHELDDVDVSFGDAVGGVLGFVKDAVTGAFKMSMTPQRMAVGALDKDEAWLEATSFLEGAAEGPAQLGSGASSAAQRAAAKITGNERGYYEAKQAHERFTEDMQDMRAAEYAGHIVFADEQFAKPLTEQLTAIDQAAQTAVGPERAELLMRQGQAAGEIFGDPSNLASMGVGAAVGASSKLPMMTRVGLKVDKVMRASSEVAEATAKAARARGILEKTQQAAQIASKQAENLGKIGRDPARMADFSRKMGLRAGMEADDLAKAEKVIQTKTAELAKLTRDNRVPLAINQAKQAVDKLKSMPPAAVAASLERIGGSLIAADDGLRAIATKYGMDGVAKVLTPAAAVGGFAVGGPIGAGVGGAAAALASGPLLKQMGNFSRVLGQELMAARGTLPFWQRVANNQTMTPLGRATAHLFDTATLGRRGRSAARVAGDTVKGAAAAYPIDLGFEILASGGEIDSNTLKSALAESLVFGGTGAAAGSIVMGGKRQLAAQQAADEVNFRSTLAPDQEPLWGRMAPGARKVTAAYSAAFPALKIDLTDNGNSYFDRVNNRVVLNTRQSDWIEPLIAHEVGHYVTVKGQMEQGVSAMLLGKGGSGGLLMSPDGRLDPGFDKFARAYNDRLEAQGKSPMSMEDIAVEYFVDAMTQDMLGRVESGDLARRAGTSAGERAVREIVRKMGAKLPIASDFLFRAGTAKDKGGKVVPGTGLAAIRTVPGARRMLDAFLDENAGRRASEKLGKAEEATPLPFREVASGPLADQFVSYFKTDENGRVIRDANGMATPIDRVTDAKRAAIGLQAIEAQREKIEAGDMLPEGELSPNGDGTWAGTHLSQESLARMEQSGVFNRKQVANLRRLNHAAKKSAGETFFVINQPSTLKRPGKRASYATLPATFREVIPVGVSVTKDGNVLVHLMSVTQLRENITKRAGSARGKKLYNSDEVAILNDVQAVMDLHRQDKKSDGYFEEKYGAADAKERKDFINTVFGLMTKEQKQINPLFDADKVGYKDNVYKTYRADRINQTIKLQDQPSFWFGYEPVKANQMPVPIVEPVEEQ